MFGISGGEFLVILLVIVVVVGPTRLPQVTRELTSWVKLARLQLAKARAFVDDEIPEDLRGFDLGALNIRRYDPRAIIREAVQEEIDEWKRLVAPLGTAASAVTSEASRDTASTSATPTLGTTDSTATTSATAQPLAIPSFGTTSAAPSATSTTASEPASSAATVASLPPLTPEQAAALRRGMEAKSLIRSKASMDSLTATAAAFDDAYRLESNRKRRVKQLRRAGTPTVRSRVRAMRTVR